VRGFSFEVPLPSETTRIAIGPLAEANLGTVAATGCLVLDQALEAAHGVALRAFAARLIREPSAPVVLPGGESCKDPAGLPGLWRQLAARGLDRESALVVAGGGALLDACGFAAATFHRGIRVVNVPTTFVGQVDAGIGGKCALNLDGAKNQVGLVRQPSCVAVDPAFLLTLPDASFRSGLGELAKSALLAGGQLHALTASRAPAVLARDPAALESAIGLALAFKASVVAEDPLDRGRRRILNAGHSAGHVIEAEALRRGLALSHGECVAIGLAIEASAHPRAARDEVVRALGRFALPSRMPFAIESSAARDLLLRDKKRQGGVMSLPVILAPGRVVLEDVPAEALLAPLAAA
jgi:shikimate kinase/3-dehydroquinate synthase